MRKATMERIRVCSLRPKDIVCDANGDVIGAVVTTVNPSPVDYDEPSEFTLELVGGGRQVFDMPSGVHVWRWNRDCAPAWDVVRQHASGRWAL